MTKVKLWMRIVGVFYVIQFVMSAFVGAPIRALGPEGVLARAAAGEPTAKFLVDTWVTFGLEVGAIGVVLLVVSRNALEAKALIWTIVGIEIARGIVADIYMIARGYDLTVCVVWIIIHSVIIVTGLAVLRSGRPTFGEAIAGASADS
jgi:hypothetical protein